MKNSIKSFYSEASGDKLVDVSNYPPEIVEYLRQEEKVISEIIGRRGYNYFVEAGCMDARCLPIAVSLGIPYYGIDIVDRYITKADERIKVAKQNNPSIAAEVHCVSIYDLPSYLKDHPPQPAIASPTIPLIIFPFNSFGNIDNPEKATQAIRESDLDFLILTYQTDYKSNIIRRRYYQNCGYTGIKVAEDDKGVKFTSLEGLNSVAYRESYIRNLFVGSFLIKVYPFAQIGIGYHGIRSRQGMRS